jgi:hypothetical protein
MKRRTYLAAVCTAGVTATAGCGTVGGRRTQELGRVELANSVDEPAEITVEILRDGTTVLDSSYQLDPGSPEERTQIVLYEWRGNPTAQKWEVRAKTTTSEWQNAVLKASRGDSDDCHKVAVVAGDWPESDVLVLPTDCD